MDRSDQRGAAHCTRYPCTDLEIIADASAEGTSIEAESFSVYAILTLTGAKTFETSETVINSTTYSAYKVAVIITKVDDKGNDLSGAVLQIFDVNDTENALDEWTTNGEKHITMLPEGNYVLHEKSAPEGYQASEQVPPASA